MVAIFLVLRSDKKASLLSHRSFGTRINVNGLHLVAQQGARAKKHQKCKIRTQNQKNHKLLESFCKIEKIEIFGPGDVGGDVFRAPWFRAVTALRSSLLLYSKGFALPSFKIE